MARNPFDMTMSLTLTDVAAATVAVAKVKSQCHRLMLQALVDAHAPEERPITAQELYEWLENNKENLTDDQRAVWDRYSPRCHMAYFVNRFKRYVSAQAEVQAEAPAEAVTA